MCSGTHLQGVLVSVIVLKDQSDCGDRYCAEHQPQAAQRYIKVLLGA